MNNGMAKIFGFVILGIFVLQSCMNNSGGNNPELRSWQKTPLDELITKLNDEKNYAVILLDMNAENDKYYHKYNVIIEHPDTVLHSNTEWEEVPDAFFAANIEHLGMEIVTKKDGTLSKSASPAGYNHYVGNSRYGRWQDRDGSSFWEFYGRYAFMSSMFNLIAYPARRSYWADYSRGGYYGSRPYYGPSGQSVYGTKSYTASSAGKNSTWGSKPSSFKQNVRSQVQRSSAARRSGSFSSGSGTAKRSRNSSRYSRTSSRSRSGGFGK